MKNKNIKHTSKSQKIKFLVEIFEKSNITFQDIIAEYNRLRIRKGKNVKTISK